MSATELLSQYIRDRGFSLKAISNATGLPPGVLYPSLGKTTRRVLRADEFLAVCAFLQVEPMLFYQPDKEVLHSAVS